jgi:hypothetical protein
MALVNDHFRLAPLKLTVWRGFGPFLALTPFMFLVELPDSPVFYAATIATSFLAGYGDTKGFEAARRFGAGLLSRLRPLSLWPIFLIWLVLEPARLRHLAEAPLRAAATLAALGLLVYGARHLRRCAVSREAFLFLSPVLAAGVAVDILNKTAMDHAPLLGGIVAYGWIQGLLIGLSGLAVLAKKGDPPLPRLFSRHATTAGAALCVILLVNTACKNTAMQLTPNPAYVTGFGFLAPFWVLIVYRLTGRKEAANVGAGLIVLGATALLALAQG